MQLYAKRKMCVNSALAVLLSELGTSTTHLRSDTPSTTPWTVERLSLLAAARSSSIITAVYVCLNLHLQLPSCHVTVGQFTTCIRLYVGM